MSKYKDLTRRQEYLSNWRAKRREENKEYHRRYRKANASKLALKKRIKTYGSMPGFEAALKELEKDTVACAICGTTEPGDKGFCVDHCHQTNVVRGILCPLCNSALGKFKDSPELLRRAVEYLERPPCLSQ